jgi:hypothetical protein
MTDSAALDDEQQVVEEFWNRLAGGELTVQQCVACGYRRWAPGLICPKCSSVDAEWVALPPRGTVWSYTTYHHAFDPQFADDLPYTVALIEVIDDVRMIGRLTGDESLFSIGDEVELILGEETVQKRRLDWRPAAVPNSGGS